MVSGGMGGGEGVEEESRAQLFLSRLVLITLLLGGVGGEEAKRYIARHLTK